MKRRIVPDLISEPRVYALPLTANAFDAAKMMHTQNIGTVLIMQGDKLEGIVSERDIIRRVMVLGLDPRTTSITEIMTKGPITIQASETVQVAFEKMHTNKCRHLPVLSPEGKVVGMVSVRDLYRCITKELEEDVHLRDNFIFDVGYGMSPKG